MQVGDCFPTFLLLQQDHTEPADNTTTHTQKTAAMQLFKDFQNSPKQSMHGTCTYTLTHVQLP